MKIEKDHPLFWDPKKRVGDNTRPSELMPIRWDQIEDSDLLLITDTEKGITQVVSMGDIKRWIFEEMKREFNKPIPAKTVFYSYLKKEKKND
jgi:hypothetical protein